MSDLLEAGTARRRGEARDRAALMAVAFNDPSKLEEMFKKTDRVTTAPDERGDFDYEDWPVA